jgi:tetratricopeptide (TPR) repeat protein
MDQTPIEPSKRSRGGDTRTPQARMETAKREEQIVQLRLRRIPFSAIARTVGVSKGQAVRGFYRALRRNTDQDIQSHHRNELADLEMEQAKYWTIIDANKDNWKAQVSALRALNFVHIRRARLLGLDAPTKLDVIGIYQPGGTDLEAEQQAREAVIEAEGIAQIQQCLATSRAIGEKVFLPQYLRWLAGAYIETGRFEGARGALTEALAAADQHENRLHEKAETYRLKGELFLRQDDPNIAEAQRCFERAIEIARKQSAKSWGLRATMSLARMPGSQGRRDEARAMLAEIYDWFTEGFDTADLIEAKGLLYELGN